MKSCRFLSFLLSAGVLAAGSLNLNAATSGAVGAVSFTVPNTPTTISLPFLKPVLVQSEVTATGSDITFGGTIPALSGPAYVHILSGTETGKIYNVLSSSGSTVTVDGAPALSVGDIAAVRLHTVISDLGTPPTFTTITMFDPGGVAVRGTYTFTGWSLSPDTVIMPGEGVILSPTSNWEITLYGSVSEDDVIYSVTGSPSVGIVGSIDPVNGAADPLQTLIAGAANFTTITEILPGLAFNRYVKTFTGWNFDPSAIDTSDYKTIVVAFPTETDFVHAGVVVAP
jgi:hypothetical protein